MKVFKIIIASLVLIILIVSIFYVSNQSQVDRFIGTWLSDDNVQMIFYSNGSYSIPPDIYGTFSIHDSTIHFTVVGGMPYTRDYNFSTDYTILTILNPEGNDLILIKQ